MWGDDSRQSGGACSRVRSMLRSIEIELGADNLFREGIVPDDERVFRIETASEPERFLSLSDDEEAVRRHDQSRLLLGHSGPDAERRAIKLFPRTTPNRLEVPR